MGRFASQADRTLGTWSLRRRREEARGGERRGGRRSREEAAGGGEKRREDWWASALGHLAGSRRKAMLLAKATLGTALIHITLEELLGVQPNVDLNAQDSTFHETSQPFSPHEFRSGLPPTTDTKRMKPHDTYNILVYCMLYDLTEILLF